ncbi:MAG: HEAT repeat domain-containing protein [Phycisphaerae bacterium]|nr:HEAT repeat domain-containing protein [Phycisphaerae bacterium]
MAGKEELKNHIEKLGAISFKRRDAAKALGELGDKQAVEPLMALLAREDDSSVQAAVAGALGKLGDKRAIEPLTTLLGGSSKCMVRAQAAKALEKFGDKQAVESEFPRTLAVLTSEKAYSSDRGEAAEALGTLGDKRAVEPLLDLLGNAEISDYLCGKVVEALGHLGDTRAVEPLLGLLANAKEADSYPRTCSRGPGQTGQPGCPRPQGSDQGADRTLHTPLQRRGSPSQFA